MRKILRLFYPLYKWLILAPVFALSTSVLGALAILISATISSRLGSLVCGTTWARLNAYLTPMWVTVSGRERVDPEQSYVIVANHQSGYDVYVLYGWLGVDFKWVMKHELRKVPALGVACEKLEHVFIDRSNTESALRSIEAAKKRIQDGTSVLFFPEGTRSKDGQLLRFKKGAFHFALDLGLPILPVTLVGTHEIMPAGSWQVLPGKAKLIFHEPIPVAGKSRADIPSLMAEARTAIESGLERAKSAPEPPG